MNNNDSRKRTAAPPQHPPEKKALMTQKEKLMDEDVFIDQTLAARLSKWTRPPLSADYVAHSRSVGEYFQLIVFRLLFGVRVLFPPIISGFWLICSEFLFLPFSFSAAGDWLCDRGESQGVAAELVWICCRYQNLWSHEGRSVVFLLSSCYKIWFLRQLETNIADLFVYSIVGVCRE